ncbi:tRNA (adenosine(37)-N6)-dimethylallyltransferase [Spiroplasma clarkii]|uniref:tRNA (adenosine(37)-N6)-dimethylallyltransferase n=1 Tax=Spiroplasma clarkii TaxID=2139 RepID=UPI0011BAA9A0|nr:tRNA dimethylallyltransferase [Spiroplasma clarkii]
MKFEHIPGFEKQFEQLSNLEVWQKLAALDHQAALKIHPNNRYRTIRALEILQSTGQTKTDIIENNHQYFYESQDLIIIGLAPNREQLYQCINQRVLRLIKQGLFIEITNAYNATDFQLTQALTCIGGKEIIQYLMQKINYETCISLMQKNNRHYARRQFTWFKNQLPDCHWFEFKMENFDNACEDIIKLIKRIIV